MLVAVGCLLPLLISLRVAHQKIFWEDEMLGWMLLRDPSWSHMVAAWKAGADGGGFAFYLTGRAWLRLFGPSEIAFRLYSATCFSVGFAAMWAAARRFYATRVLAFSLFLIWFFGPVLVRQVGEGRFYGLLLASVSLCVLAYVQSTRPVPLPAWMYVAVFAAHALLITSHILGIVYSGFILLATVVMDRLDRRWRWGLYLSIMASWLLLIPEHTAIASSVRVGHPHFWAVQPTLREFSLAYSAYSLRLAMMLIALGIGLTIRLVRSHQPRLALSTAVRERTPTYVLTACMLLVPIAFWIEGEIGTPIFIERYLIPVSVGLVFLFAEGLTLLDPASLVAPRYRLPLTALGAIVFALVLINYDFTYLPKHTQTHNDYTGQLSAALPKGVPVVCEDAWAFTEIIGRQHNSGVQYTYILDWPFTIGPQAPRLEVTQYHLMENWKKVGYFSGSIEYRDRFLEQHPDFLVMQFAETTPESITYKSHDAKRQETIGNPLANRLAHDPNYQVSLYKVVHMGLLRATIWSVHRVGSSIT